MAVTTTGSLQSVWQPLDLDKHPSIESLQEQDAIMLQYKLKSSRKSFLKWRPSYHLMAPWGWMNDPCAPGYDSNTQTYYTAFQWNPRGNDWGDITWGQATSRDLISWEIQKTPCLEPTTSYDGSGVFSGCFRGTGVRGEENHLTLIYTSVNKLPIHYTLPYNRGAESLSLATSKDGGKTWEKLDCNPVLPGAPEGLEVTGWRDPYVAPWPSMDRLLGRKESQYVYGLISGGIVDETPTTFLYSIPVHDLTEWEYLGPLARLGLNHRISRWSGDKGVNWECTNFVSLRNSDGNARDFLLMSAEGPIHDAMYSELRYDLIARGRMNRAQQWISGSLKKTTSSGQIRVNMNHEFGGVFDYGCFYAGASFWDPTSEQQVIWGWISEEDLPDDLRQTQNWSGSLTLPRHISLQTTKYVERARISDLRSITSIIIEPDAYGTFNVQTLGIIPVAKTEGLRSQARRMELSSKLLYSGSIAHKPALDIITAQWELDCEFSVGIGCSRVGFSIGHSVDQTLQTTLSFYPDKELFTVERATFPNAGQKVNTATESAPHTLFTTVDPQTKERAEEMLKIRAWYDNSVLEIFVNERTAISTRLYCDDSETCFGISFFAEHHIDGAGNSSKENEATMLQSTALYKAVAWDGLAADIKVIF